MPHPYVEFRDAPHAGNPATNAYARSEIAYGYLPFTWHKGQISIGNRHMA